MNIGDTFKFTNKPSMGVYDEELSGITVGKTYTVIGICISGSELFIDDDDNENYAASSTDGMLKDFVEVISTDNSQVDNYKAWYDEAIEASNECGFACMSAADVIRYQDAEIKRLREVEAMYNGLCDDDNPTNWGE